MSCSRTQGSDTSEAQTAALRVKHSTTELPLALCELQILSTLSPCNPVRMKVEKTGNGCCALADQHSTVAPIGRQNIGTESGRGKSS